MPAGKVDVRAPCPEDASKIIELVKKSKPLVDHRGSHYSVLHHYNRNVCFVMEEEGQIIGYVDGLSATAFHDTFYLWQLCVSQGHRRKSYAHVLIQRVVDETKKLSLKNFQFSLEPDNEASLATFSTFAARMNRTMKKVGELSFYNVERGKTIKEDIYEFQI